MIQSSTVCHEMDTVEVGDGQNSRRIGVVGSFETSDWWKILS